MTDSTNTEERKVALGNVMTIQAVAKYLSVHDNTVRNWIRSGSLKCIRLPGGGVSRCTIRIPEENLKEFLSSRTK
jgi:excisionase family DNA binding protein